VTKKKAVNLGLRSVITMAQTLTALKLLDVGYCEQVNLSFSQYNEKITHNGRESIVNRALDGSIYPG
jgi:hypothetical protein